MKLLRILWLIGFMSIECDDVILSKPFEVQVLTQNLDAVVADKVDLSVRITRPTPRTIEDLQAIPGISLSICGLSNNSDTSDLRKYTKSQFFDLQEGTYHFSFIPKLATTDCENKHNRSSVLAFKYHGHILKLVPIALDIRHASFTAASHINSRGDISLAIQAINPQDQNIIERRCFKITKIQWINAHGELHCIHQRCMQCNTPTLGLICVSSWK